MVPEWSQSHHSTSSLLELLSELKIDQPTLLGEQPQATAIEIQSPRFFYRSHPPSQQASSSLNIGGIATYTWIAGVRKVQKKSLGDDFPPELRPSLSLRWLQDNCHTPSHFAILQLKHLNCTIWQAVSNYKINLNQPIFSTHCLLKTSWCCLFTPALASLKYQSSTDTFCMEMVAWQSC